MVDPNDTRSVLRRAATRVADWTALPENGAGRLAPPARSARPARSPGRFGGWHAAGLTVVALLIGSPLLAHSKEQIGRVTARVALAGAESPAPATGTAPTAVRPRRARGSVAVPTVGTWADRVGVPVDPPTAGPVSSGFGLRRHPVWGGSRHHAGIDLAARLGAPVRATASGVVGAAGAAGGYGLRVEVYHAPSGLTTRYAHLSRFAPTLRVGARVRRGQVLGFVGATGVVTGPHLHYEVLRRDGQALDPAALATRYRTAYAEATAALERALQRQGGGPAPAPPADGHTDR
ncbi:M23 family metallopeptidase [Rubrivirga litoralis]|uniref:M23 family metallopeptidase n=1 Tax=Rubrivirga litoralis TaxID=3075598 RepID=A0ABU3BVI5_9BACT|nr:M23 family metallopeptidase [Rubrivirga sp. F394]MDT0633292.1 M23 family metallopeptidase [Rubrivirga sp. F394]